MKIFSTSVAVFLFLSIVACSSKKEPGELLVKANEVHLEAVSTYEQTHERFDALKKSAEEQNDSLSLARLDSIHEVLHQWKDGLYEVPGFDHAHDHSDGDHAHEHKVAPQMTDQSMLDYQQNAKAAIDEILMFLDNNF